MQQNPTQMMSRNKNGIRKQRGQLLTFDNSLKIKNVSM